MEEGHMVAPIREVMEMLEGAEVGALAARAQGGDREAYGELFRRFLPGVHATLLKWLRDPVEADDVAQDVFIHGMRKLPQLRDVRCFAGWLKQIAVRLALNRLSRRRPPPAGETVLVHLPSHGSGPAVLLEQVEARVKVHQTLARLGRLDREVLREFYLHGRSLQEISELLDAPVGTIKRRLHTARQRFREELEPHCDLGPCPA